MENIKPINVKIVGKIDLDVPKKKKVTTELLQGIEEQIDQQQRKVKYDIRELTMEYYVNKFHKGDMYVPDYQREFVWDEKHESRFIESILLELPVPMIFVAATENSRWEIVDGSQRVRTIDAFMNDGFELTGLKKLTKLNGLCFSQLPQSIQLMFKDSAMRLIVLSKQTTEEARKEMFDRINTSGVSLLPMEIRRGVYRGEFTDFIIRLANEERFKKLCPLEGFMKKRREEEEMVLRLFAFSETYPHFKIGRYSLEEYGVAEFLDHYIDLKNEANDTADMKQKESEFWHLVDFIEKYFPKQGFAKAKNVPGVSKPYFEAIAVGGYMALKDNPTLAPKSLEWTNCNTNSHTDLFDLVSNRYRTHKPYKLRQRIEYAYKMFLQS